MARRFVVTEQIAALERKIDALGGPAANHAAAYFLSHARKELAHGNTRQATLSVQRAEVELAITEEDTLVGSSAR